MTCPANADLSTIAAHNRGSVNVFVQEENGSLEAIATAERSSRSVSTWNSSSAPRRVKLKVPQLVDEDQVNSAVAVDQFGQLLIVGRVVDSGAGRQARCASAHGAPGAVDPMIATNRRKLLHPRPHPPALT
jgi:hypothetical protein